MKTMNASELRNYREREHEKSYLLIDVRQPVEYEASHIPGSILLPLNEFEEQVEELPEKNLIFYCKSGIRSRAAALTADFFNEAGKEIYNLEGGMLAWNGITIHGLPSFKVFDMEKGINEIFLDAMNLEKGAFRFYEHLLKRCCSHKGLHGVIESVKDGERGHARIIYSHLKRNAPDTIEFDELYENLEGDILEGGTPFDEMVKLIEARGEQLTREEPQMEEMAQSNVKRENNQIIDTLEMAISMEYRAFDLYRVISERTSEEKSLQETFYSLAQSEKAHMNTLVETLEQLLIES